LNFEPLFTREYSWEMGSHLPYELLTGLLWCDFSQQMGLTGKMAAGAGGISLGGV